MNGHDLAGDEHRSDALMAARGVPLADFEDQNGQLPQERKQQLDAALQHLAGRAQARSDRQKVVWTVADAAAVRVLGRLLT